jgi:hypothetical protein
MFYCNIGWINLLNKALLRVYRVDFNFTYWVFGADFTVSLANDSPIMA